MLGPTRRTVIGFLFTVNVFGCSADDATAPVSHACFNVSLGMWAPDLPEPLPPLPAVIRLIDSLGVDGLEVGRKQVLSVPPENAGYRWAWWEQSRADSLRVVFSTGFTGVTLLLAARGDDFEGAAGAFFDFSSDAPSATARLTRTGCR